MERGLSRGDSSFAEEIKAIVSPPDGASSTDLKPRRFFLKSLASISAGIIALGISNSFGSYRANLRQARSLSGEGGTIPSGSTIHGKSMPRRNLRAAVKKISDNQWTLTFGNVTCDVNGVGGEVLMLCNGQSAVDQIAGMLARDYGKTMDCVLTDCISYLGSLRELGIISC